MGEWERKLQIEVQRQEAEIERLTAEVERLRAQRNHLMNVCPIGTLLTMDGETICKGDNEWVTLTPEGA